MSRFATLAFALFSIACQPSDEWMDSGDVSEDASGRDIVDGAGLEGAKQLALTVKVDRSIRYTDEWKITYSLRRTSKSWTLVGSCRDDAELMSDGIGGGLDGCSVTCHDLNAHKECNTCDIDCTEADTKLSDIGEPFVR